jgi:hypothetical protein
MADPNMSDFYRRVDRLQKARAKGMGFEAPGALGRSYYNRGRAPRRSILGPILLLLVAVFLLKGIMIVEVGRAEYQARVGVLMAAEGVEHLGGWMMQIDPVSDWVAEKVGPYLPPMH